MRIFPQAAAIRTRLADVVPGEEVRNLPADGDANAVAFWLVEEDIDPSGTGAGPCRPGRRGY